MSIVHVVDFLSSGAARMASKSTVAILHKGYDFFRRSTRLHHPCPMAGSFFFLAANSRSIGNRYANPCSWTSTPTHARTAPKILYSGLLGIHRRSVHLQHLVPRAYASPQPLLVCRKRQINIGRHLVPWKKRAISLT